MSTLLWFATGAAGLACSWIVSPPASTAGRAAWAALVLGFLASAGLMAFDHRAALVLALPIAALSAPLAVIRRHRAGSQTQEIPAARGRVVAVLLGTLLFALGVNVAALNPAATWPESVLALGAALIAGVLPFHRPVTQSLRNAPADIRAPAVLMFGPALWIALARWTPHPAWSGLATLLPLLTLWLGSFLILARGDLPRLASATVLFATGQVATASIFSTSAASAVAASLTAPLMLVTLLISKLERNSGTREISELGGLARRLPRLSIALAAAVFWLLGTAVLAAPQSLMAASLHGRPTTSAWQALGEIWPVYVPQVIALWGWLLALRDLLVGPERSLLFPEPLRERVSTPQADRPLEDLTAREFAAVVVFTMIGLAT